MTLRNKMDINNDGKVDSEDIKEAIKKYPKWKAILISIGIGIFILGSNFGPVILEIFLKS